MATETTYPTGTVAEPGKGTICSNLSTGSPGGSCDCDAQSDCLCCATCSLNQRSVRYLSWENPSFDNDYSSLNLKFSWSVSGGGSGCLLAKGYVEYSTNSGSSWTAVSGFPKNITGSSSGTSSASMPSPSPWNHAAFRVRVYAEATCDEILCSSGSCTPPCSGANCSATIDVDNLRLEGTYAIGACCQTCGTCQTGKTSSTCSGIFQGDGTDCSPDPCPQPTGACCNAGVCTETTEVACAHTWQGCGTDCSPNPCSQPTGSCCDSETDECSVTTEAACSGTWTESGTCDPNPCSTGGGMTFSFGF